MLIRQTILYIPAQVVGPLFQFAAVVAWTHFLLPHELGVFALVAAAQELAHAAVLFWFSLYTMRYYDSAGGSANRTSYLDTESAVLISATVMTAVGLLILPLIVEGAWTWQLEAATVFYAVTRGAVAQYSDRARAEHDTLTYSVLQICWPVLGLFLGVLFLYTFEGGTVSVLLGYGVAQAISIVIAFYRLGIGRHPERASTEAVGKALSYGLPLVFGAILVWVANNGIRFVVEHEAGAAAVGLLTVGWGLGMRATSFASMLTTAAAFPVAMKRARDDGMDEGQSQLVRNGVLLLAALAPIAVGLWTISEPLVELIVAADYHDTTIAILPLAVAAGAVRSVRIHFGEQVFMLREASMVPLVNDIVDAVASIAGSYAGLMYAGLPGAVAGCVAAALLSLIVTLVWGWWSYRFTFPADAFLRISAAVVAMAFAVKMLPVEATSLGVAMAVCTGAFVYTLTLALLYPEGRAKMASLARGVGRRISL
ncbi:MAG: lipopolysaccharide biosynthesis protein [Hyphomicrobium sp.]